LRVRTLDRDEVVEIDTPNGALSLARPGFYRVDVNDGGDQTTVTVRAGGEAEIAADGPAVSIPNGQTVVWSGLNAPVSGMLAASAGDEFDDWCLARDRHAEGAGSVRYVSRDMIGLRRSRRPRHVAGRVGLRAGVAPARARGVGAVPIRPLVVGRAVGLDVD